MYSWLPKIYVEVRKCKINDESIWSWCINSHALTVGKLSISSESWSASSLKNPCQYGLSFKMSLTPFGKCSRSIFFFFMTFSSICLEKRQFLDWITSRPQKDVAQPPPPISWEEASGFKNELGIDLLIMTFRQRHLAGRETFTRAGARAGRRGTISGCVVISTPVRASRTLWEVKKKILSTFSAFSPRGRFSSF